MVPKAIFIGLFFFFILAFPQEISCRPNNIDYEEFLADKELMKDVCPDLFKGDKELSNLGFYSQQVDETQIISKILRAVASFPQNNPSQWNRLSKLAGYLKSKAPKGNGSQFLSVVDKERLIELSVLLLSQVSSINDNEKTITLPVYLDNTYFMSPIQEFLVPEYSQHIFTSINTFFIDDRYLLGDLNEGDFMQSFNGIQRALFNGAYPFPSDSTNLGAACIIEATINGNFPLPFPAKGEGPIFAHQIEFSPLGFFAHDYGHYVMIQKNIFRAFLDHFKGQSNLGPSYSLSPQEDLMVVSSFKNLKNVMEYIHRKIYRLAAIKYYSEGPEEASLFFRKAIWAFFMIVHEKNSWLSESALRARTYSEVLDAIFNQTRISFYNYDMQAYGTSENPNISNINKIFKTSFDAHPISNKYTFKEDSISLAPLGDRIIATGKVYSNDPSSKEPVKKILSVFTLQQQNLLDMDEEAMLLRFAHGNLEYDFDRMKYLNTYRTIIEDEFSRVYTWLEEELKKGEDLDLSLEAFSQQEH